MIDTEHVFHGKRLKVKLIRRIVVRRNRFRVAVDDNRLKAELFQRLCRMNTAVIEFDSLPDPVRPAAQNHNFVFIGACRTFILHMIAGKIVCRILRGADMNSLPGLYNAKAFTLGPDFLLRNRQQLRKIAI